MIKCKIFTGYIPDDRCNDFIKENNISYEQIKDIKYVPTIGTNRDPVHNIFLLYDDTPIVENTFGNIQPELYQYINYTGTPN